MRLKDKVVIVTGGGTGIGKAIAIGMAKEGASVVIANRTRETGRKVIREIERLKRKALFVQADVSKEKDRTRIVKETINNFGKIDILVNNAAVTTLFAPFLEVTEEIFDTVIDINLKGLLFLSQKVAKEMVKQRKGKIINIGSIRSDIAQERHSPYAASKGGIRALTRCMALELAKYNINVNIISPGMIRVENAERFYDDPVNQAMFAGIPLGKVGMPTDIVGTAVLLASDESDYITGTTIVIDGGFSYV